MNNISVMYTVSNGHRWVLLLILDTIRGYRIHFIDIPIEYLNLIAVPERHGLLTAFDVFANMDLNTKNACISGVYHFANSSFKAFANIQNLNLINDKY